MQEGRLAHPISQRGPVERHALAGIDLGLTVERQVVGILGHEHVRHRCLGRDPALDKAGGRRGLHDHVLARPAGVLRSAGDADAELGRHDVEALGYVLANDVEVAATTGTGAVVQVDHPLEARQMSRKGTAVGPALAGAGFVGADVSGVVLGLPDRLDLLGLLQPEEKLIHGQALGAATEAMTLEFLDDLVQPVDLGLTRHQHRLQGGGVIWQAYDRFAHEADLSIDHKTLPAPSTGLDRHLGRVRRVHAAPVEALQKGLQLSRREPHHAVADRGPAELSLLQPLRQQAHSGTVEVDELDPVGATRAEDVDGAAERVSAQALAHQGGQPLGPFAEAHGLGGHHDAHRAGRPDHASPFSALIAAAIVAGETPSPIRTVTPAAFTSMPAARRRGEALLARRLDGMAAAGCASDSGAITAGTKTCGAAAAWRASRRQVKSCCGVSPWRRATTDTTAPGTSVSSRIRARSSALQRLRPAAPLITSKRRTLPSGSSLWSSLDTKRSSKADRHSAGSGRPEEGVVRTPLTLHQPAHALGRGVDLTQVAHLAPTLAVSDSDGIAQLGHVDPDENLGSMAHGSSSCGEDRLGPAGQPSTAQCRASHPGSADIRC